MSDGEKTASRRAAYTGYPRTFDAVCSVRLGARRQPDPTGDLAPPAILRPTWASGDPRSREGTLWYRDPDVCFVGVGASRPEPDLAPTLLL